MKKGGSMFPFFFFKGFPHCFCGRISSLVDLLKILRRACNHPTVMDGRTKRSASCVQISSHNQNPKREMDTVGCRHIPIIAINEYAPFQKFFTRNGGNLVFTHSANPKKENRIKKNRKKIYM